MNIKYYVLVVAMAFGVMNAAEAPHGGKDEKRNGQNAAFVFELIIGGSTSADEILAMRRRETAAEIGDRQRIIHFTTEEIKAMYSMPPVDCGKVPSECMDIDCLYCKEAVQKLNRVVSVPEIQVQSDEIIAELATKCPSFSAPRDCFKIDESDDEGRILKLEEVD